MPRLSASDYEGVLAVLREAADVEEPIVFPERVLAALRRLVPSDVVTYRELPGGEAALVSTGEPRGPIPADFRAACKRYWHQDRLEPFRGARKVSDVLSMREFHRTELYQYVSRPVGIEDMFRLWLATESGSGARLEFDRAQRDFSERDRHVLDVLAPHLAQLRRHALSRQERLPSVTPSLTKLTTREHEILDLVAAGMTNKTIAAQLWVSPGTVRKHLENIFRKLGVHTRAAAVAAVSPVRDSR